MATTLAPVQRHPATQPDALSALDPRERRIIEYSLKGCALKLIAIELDMSEPSASRVRKIALEKLGLSSVVELLRRDDLRRPEPAGTRPALDALTRAEQEILQCVATGHTNRAIAARRCTSRHTIANQLSHLYRKLGVGSRNELLVRFASALA